MANLETKLEHYRNIVTQILKNHAQYQPSHGEIESLTLGDAIAVKDRCQLPTNHELYSQSV